MLFLVCGTFVFTIGIEKVFAAGITACTLTSADPCGVDISTCSCTGTTTDYVCDLSGNTCRPVYYPTADNTDFTGGFTIYTCETSGTWSPDWDTWQGNQGEEDATQSRTFTLNTSFDTSGSCTTGQPSCSGDCDWYSVTQPPPLEYNATGVATRIGVRSLLLTFYLHARRGVDVSPRRLFLGARGRPARRRFIGAVCPDKSLNFMTCG